MATKQNVKARPEAELPTREDVLLTLPQVAQLLNVTEHWVKTRSHRYFPSVKVGKFNRWRRSDIQAYLDGTGAGA